jgi:hypothetical protein
MRLISATLFLALAGNAIAQQVVEGTVLNATTGTPVHRAQIGIRRITANSFPNPQAPGFAAFTNNEGKFELANVEPGSYSVEVQRSGFVTHRFKDQITISAGERIKGFDFKLIPHAVVAGRVLDQDGSPLANMQIRVLRSHEMNGKQTMHPIGFTQSSDTGEFRIAGLAAGRYWLLASNQNSIQSYNSKLLRYDFDKPQTDYAKTYFPSSQDEAGARPFDLAASQTLAGLEIRMKLERVFRIRGKLLASIPAAGLRIEAVPRTTDRTSSFPDDEAILNDDGTFEISRLFPGPYFVTAMQATGNRNVIGKTPVDIVQQNVDNVVIGKIESVTVPGSIRIEGTPAGSGPSLQSIQLSLSSALGDFDSFRQAKPDTSGSFRFENVAPSRFRLGIQNLPDGVWSKSATAAGRNILNVETDLSTGPIEIVLATGTGSVTGTVSNAKGQPASGLVILQSQPPRPGLTHNLPSSPNGRFHLPNLAPGDYTIYAVPPFGASNPPSPGSNEAAKAKARKITIAPNSQNQVDLTLAN